MGYNFHDMNIISQVQAVALSTALPIVRQCIESYVKMEKFVRNLLNEIVVSKSGVFDSVRSYF